MTSRSNSILIDWFSMTSKLHTPEEIMKLLGMHELSWTLTNGARGYQDRYWFDSISIHFNGRADMGVWLEMSGQGCRAFETYGNGDYNTLFTFALENLGPIHITRIDIAFDEYTGILNMDKLCKHTSEHKYRSLADYYSVTSSSNGQSINIGSPQSAVLIRIYDKLAERLSKMRGEQDKEKIRDEIQHWIRIELQMRDERALEFVRLVLDKADIGQVYSGVLRHYLEYGWYRDAEDSKSFEVFPYWQKIINSAESLSIYVSPGVDYNLARCQNYVFNCAGNAIDALLQIHGIELFKTMLEKRDISQNQKYLNLIKKHTQNKGCLKT